jgi:hypothetical protein
VRLLRRKSTKSSVNRPSTPGRKEYKRLREASLEAVSKHDHVKELGEYSKPNNAVVLSDVLRKVVLQE